jgi:hypothetical protein
VAPKRQGDIVVRRARDPYIPAEDKQGKTGVQAELIRSVLKTNEDYFGKTRYIMHSQENADVFALFVDDPDYMLTLVIMRPYSYDGRVMQVMGRLALD